MVAQYDRWHNHSSLVIKRITGCSLVDRWLMNGNRCVIRGFHSGTIFLKTIVYWNQLLVVERLEKDIEMVVLSKNLGLAEVRIGYI